MFKSNNKIKALIISMLAALAIALGILAFTFMPNTKTQSASASAGAVTLTLEPTQSSYSTLSTSTVSIQVKIKKTSGTAKIGAVGGDITFDGSVFSITDDDFVPHAKWGDDSSISADTNKVTIQAQAAAASGDLADTEFVAITLNFTVNKSAVQEKSYDFTFINDKWACVTNIGDGDEFDINPVKGTAVFARPSSNAALSSVKVNNVNADITKSPIEVTIPYTNSSSLNITATAEDGGASVAIPVKNISWGGGLTATITNSIKVTPASGSADAVNYSIKVTRQAPKTTTNGSVAIGNGSPASISLNGTESAGSTSVAFAKRNEVKITVTGSDDAKVGDIKVGSTTVTNGANIPSGTLHSGANTLTVQIKSQGAADNVTGYTSNVKTYSITINVAAPDTTGKGTVTLTNSTAAGGVTLSATMADVSVGYTSKNNVTITVTPDTASGSTVGNGCIIVNGGTAQNNGTKLTLNDGDNTVKVIVRSEAFGEDSSKVTEYTFKVKVTEGNPSGNLKSVKLHHDTHGDLPATLTDGKWVTQAIPNTYSLTGWTLVAEIDTTTNPNAKIVSGTGAVTLKAGENLLPIAVEAETKDNVPWIVSVNVQEEDGEDNSKEIGEVKLVDKDGETISPKAIRYYELESDNTNGIKLSATAANVESKVYIGTLVGGTVSDYTGGESSSYEKLLALQSNTTHYFNIKVEGTNGEFLEYTVTVKVKGNGTDPGIVNDNVDFKNQNSKPISKEKKYTPNPLTGVPIEMTYIKVKENDVLVKVVFTVKDKNSIVKLMLPGKDPQTLSVNRETGEIICDVAIRDVQADGSFSDIFGYIGFEVTPSGGDDYKYQHTFYTEIEKSPLSFSTATDNFSKEVDFFGVGVSKVEGKFELGKSAKYFDLSVLCPDSSYDVEVLLGTQDSGVMPLDDGAQHDLKFLLEDGVNNIVVRVSLGDRSVLGVFTVTKPIGGGLNVGMLVAIIILAVLFVAATVVMAVYIGKYVSSNKKQNSEYRD